MARKKPTFFTCNGLTQGNLSSHLAKLEAAGYVLIEKTFKGKYPLTVCRLTQKGRVCAEDPIRLRTETRKREARVTSHPQA
jgi:hypothetical protein